MRAAIVSRDVLMLQYSPLGFPAAVMGRGAMVAQRTLDPYILVRIRAPQPYCFEWIFVCSTKKPILGDGLPVLSHEPRVVRYGSARAYHLIHLACTQFRDNRGSVVEELL